jgi:hypothetical protein
VGLKKKCARSCWKRLDRKIGAPDTHAWRAGWAGASKKNCAHPAEKRWPDRTNKKKFLHAHPYCWSDITNKKKFLHAHPCCWPDSTNKKFLHAHLCCWPDNTKVSACKAKKNKKSARAAGGSDQTLHAKKKILHAHQTGLHTKKKIWRAQVLLSGSKQKICAPGKWPDKACLHAKENCARRRGSDCTGKSGAPDTQTNKKWREMTGQKKKGYWRAGEAVAKRPDTKMLRDKRKKVQRDKKGQVTDLRPVKKVLCAPAGCDRKKNPTRLTLLQLTDLREQACAVRPGRDRFNRSTKPVQPVLTRMVLVKTG